MKLSPNLKILAVDDNMDSLIIIKGILNKKGFKNVITTLSAEEAKSILLQSINTNEPVQLVLSDWEMPGVNGKDLLTYIRENQLFSNLPFIMISSNSGIKHIKEAIESGVNSYILKPVNYDVVINKIAAVMTC